MSTVDDTTTITELKTENDQTMSTTKAVVILVVIFLASLLILAYLYYNFPQLTEYVLKIFDTKGIKKLAILIIFIII